MPDDGNKRCLARDRYDAAVLDLDGVITRTAKAHAAAWKAMFDAFLAARPDDGRAQKPFDSDHDYRRYVDGKPRLDGVRSFLASRGIELPEGQPDDPPERDTVCALGNRKNRLFLRRLHDAGVEAYASSVDLVRHLRAAGIRTAVVSSSRNCRAILEAADILELFDARVDGVDLERPGMAGKPAPDMFLEAARRLGAEPGRTLGIEDALAGVEAIRAAGFGLVIGVDRADQGMALRRHGADLVVHDLDELQVAATSTGGTADNPPSALAHLEEILGSGRRPALFLDYDGTLTPIVERPDQATLSGPMRGVLDRLRRLCPVAVISGRDLADVRGLIDIPEVWYAGSHGFDIAGPHGERGSPGEIDDFLPVLDGAERELRERLRAIDGCLVERKRFAIAVHYRRVAEGALETVRQTVEQVHDRCSALRLSGGKKVHELQPDIEWDKGRALQWLMQRQDLNPAEVLPIYIGDDVTDEDAFRVLAGQGIGILVSRAPGETLAAYRLDDPAAVEKFLGHLADSLAGAGR